MSCSLAVKVKLAPQSEHVSVLSAVPMDDLLSSLDIVGSTWVTHSLWT